MCEYRDLKTICIEVINKENVEKYGVLRVDDALEICEELLKLNCDEIIAIRKYGNYPKRIDVGIKTQSMLSASVQSNLGESVKISRGHIVTINTPDNAVTDVYVKGAPLEWSQYRYSRIFGFYGEVKFVNFMSLREGETERKECKFKQNGIVKIRMRVKKSIPSSLSIDNERIEVYHKGQVRTCYNCGGGHIKADCDVRNPDDYTNRFNLEEFPELGSTSKITETAAKVLVAAQEKELQKKELEAMLTKTADPVEETEESMDESENMKIIAEADKVDEAEKVEAKKVDKVDDTGMDTDNGMTNDNSKFDGNSLIDDSGKIDGNGNDLDKVDGNSKADDSGKIVGNGLVEETEKADANIESIVKNKASIVNNEDKIVKDDTARPQSSKNSKKDENKSKTVVSAEIHSEETITASEGEKDLLTPAQIAKDDRNLTDSDDEMCNDVASLTEMVDATNLEALDKTQEINNHDSKEAHLSPKKVTSKVQSPMGITDKSNSTTFRSKVNELNQTKENIVFEKGASGSNLTTGSRKKSPKGSKRKPVTSSNEDTDKEGKTTIRKERESTSNLPRSLKYKKNK